MSRAAISGRAVGRLFDIVRWDYRERFPTGRNSMRARPSSSCKPGLRRFPVFVLLGPVMDGNRGRGAGRRSRSFPVVILELTGRLQAPVVPALPVFLLLFTEKNRGTEWVGPRARSLIAASRLAMLAAVQGDNGVQ
jgi:hypothetical protein